MPNIILVVEDYDDTRRLLKVMLEQLGHQVIEADDGYEAVERAKRKHPDLILMDMALPTMDGLAATKAIRGIEEISHVPIVGITAFDDFYTEKAEAAGCDLVIKKPVDLKELEVVINSFVQ